MYAEPRPMQRIVVQAEVHCMPVIDAIVSSSIDQDDNMAEEKIEDEKIWLEMIFFLTFKQQLFFIKMTHLSIPSGIMVRKDFSQ